jgi:low temperature requirement protein LtrA
VPTFELFFDLVHILTLTQITQLMAQCLSSHTQIKSRVLLKAHTAVAGLEFKCPLEASF